MINRLDEILPARTMRAALRKRLVPPLWMWLRAGFMVLVGLGLQAAGMPSIAKILYTLAVVQLASISVAVFFQELANAIKRLLAGRNATPGQGKKD
jgi:hypothetical protein